MSSDIIVNNNFSVTLDYIGNRKIPILIIDDWLDNAESLKRFPPENLSDWKIPSTLYPGIWADPPANYIHLLLNTLAPYAKSVFGIHCKPVDASCFFGIITKRPEELQLFQTAPHVDTLYTPQLATVHYLCDDQHGGTSFYRHKKTGHETVTLHQWKNYRTILEKELASQKGNRKYMDGDNEFFERIKECKAKFNRLLVYPSQALHSGQLKLPFNIDKDIGCARLTINSFIGYYVIGP